MGAGGGVPPPQMGRMGQATPNLSIDQPRHGTRACRMVLPMMPIRLVQPLIPAHPSKRVLNLDPSSRERSVERDVLGWPIFPTWFAPWRGAQPFRMQIGDPNGRQIADAAATLGPAREQARLFQQR